MIPAGIPSGRIASFATTTPSFLRQMPTRPKPPPEEDIEEFFLKGSGPGGQKIVCHIWAGTGYRILRRLCTNEASPAQNKTNSAVQLRHKPTGIVVKSQATRSREQNRKIARDLLAARLDEMVNGDQSRTAIVGSVKKQRSDSAAKKSRRKYRKLEEEKQKAEAVANGATEGGNTE